MVSEQFDILDTNLLPALVRDYLNGVGSIKHLYEHPFTLDAFDEAIRKKSQSKVNRPLLVEVLKEQYDGLTTSELVSFNIDSLLSDNTFTVTAAHQPCLFLGPLYNIYKIACTINLAHQLSEKYPHQHFVPVFWMGTEDHDVEELSHVYIGGKKIEWQHTSTGASGKWEVKSMLAAIEDLKSIQNIDASLVKLIEIGIHQAQTFGAFTQYLLNELFKDYGLVVLNQDSPKLKRAFASIIEDEVLNNRAKTVLQPTLDFLEKNYKVQAKPRDINFFYLGENFRERIVETEQPGNYKVVNTDIEFDHNRIKNEIESTPERFSPNVIFRPIYQELILPNLVFLGGAGELSYWLQLKPLFNYYNIPYPILGLRSSAILTNESTFKKMGKLGLKVADFMFSEDEVVGNFVKQQAGDNLLLTEEMRLIDVVFEKIIQKASLIDNTLIQSTLTEKQKIIASMQNLEAKLLRAEKRKQETSVNQLKAVYSVIFPNQVFQERRENFATFYSTKFLHLLVQNLNPITHKVQVINTF